MSNASDFIIGNGVLTKYDGPGGDVVIPDGITAIGRHAFNDCGKLERVIIPESVTEIGDGAFQDCSRLKEVGIPPSVTAIGYSVFCRCSSLEYITIPEGVTVIPVYAFLGCSSLKNIVIPGSVSVLERDAFYGCDALKTVTVEGEKVTGVKSAFNKESDILFFVKKLTMLSPEQRRRSCFMFAKCGGDCEEPYRSIYLKHIKTKASEYMVMAINNPELRELMCREKLIPAQEAEVYLEAARERQHESAIALMEDYIANHLNGDQREQAKKEKAAKQEKKMQRKRRLREKGGIEGLTFAITGDLTTFENRTQLKEYLAQQGAFLVSAMSDKVDYLIMNDPGTVSEKSKRAWELEAEVITEETFNAMAGRQFDITADHVLRKYAGSGGDVVIPAGVTAIGRAAFCRCEGLKSVVIPEGVTEIGAYAFARCYNLESVAIPESVTSIGFGAFEGCTNLENVVIPDGVTSIGGQAFYECRKLTRVTVPAGVTQLDGGQFAHCESLSSVELREGLTLIGDHVFYDCGKLESIVVPEGVTSIGYEAFNGIWRFHGTGNLKQVTLPKSIRSIHKEAFDRKSKTLFLVEKFSVLTPEQRMQTVILFAEKGAQCAELYRSAYFKHIKSKAADYMDAAMKHPALLELMHREKLIPAQEANAFLEAAQNSGNAEAIALMLDYTAKGLDSAEKKKAEKKKETAEETVFARKLARQGKTGIDGLNFVSTNHLRTYDSRGALKEWVEAYGGKLASAVNAKVDYLITNGHADDEKKKIQAEELGIDLITERQFNEMVNRRFVILSREVLTQYVGAGGDVVIPEFITAIRGDAFAGCREVTGVVIPKGVTSIGEGAFRHCTGLKSVALPQGITNIHSRTFDTCTDLERVDIPASVRRIGEYAFSHCSKLTQILVPEGVRRIERGTFMGCMALTKLVLPGSITFIAPDAFKEDTWRGIQSIPNLTIHAPAGSYAETYAKKNKIPFVAE